MVRTAPKSCKSLNSLKMIYLLIKKNGHTPLVEALITVHLIKHWIVFINGTKKLQQELWKIKRYRSPIISYSACHRELWASNSTPVYLRLFTSSFKPPPSAHHHGSAERPTTSNTVTTNLPVRFMFCNMFFTVSVISLWMGKYSIFHRRYQYRREMTWNTYAL